LIILFGLSACRGQQDEIVKDITWQKYVSGGRDFSIELPSDWDVASQGIAYVYAYDPTDDASIAFMLNRGIGYCTLEEYADIWYKAGTDWGDSQDNQKISSSQFKIAGSIPVEEYTEEFTYEGEDGKYKGTEVFFVTGGNGYRFYAESSMDKYDYFKPIFDYVIQSFRTTDIASSKVVLEPYTNEEYNISARLPSDWWAEASEEHDAVFGNRIATIYAPGYETSGGLIAKECQGGSLDEMNAAYFAALKEYYDRYEIVSEKTIDIDGVEALEIISIIDGGYGEYKGKAVGFVSGGLYYRAHFSTKTDAFEFFEPTWDDIFRSIVLVQING
jgi:hypothetical protein